MAVELNPEQQQNYDLILRNLQEKLGDEKLRSVLASGKHLEVYWGTATTGKPHIAYFVPMAKVADFLKAGCKVTILFADLHAYLDNMKSSWELLQKRVVYYEHVIKTLLECVHVPLDNLHFVRGTEFQLNEQYTIDVLRLATNVSQRDSHKAGAEVVKQSDSPCISGLLYPLLQALDEEHLKVDAQFGGVDQRKIFILAEEQLPKLGMTKRIHLMNPMVPGLKGTKMSSSEADSKIDVLDASEVVSAKIASAVCEAGQVTDNGILSFAEFVILPLLHGKPFIVETKDGGRSFTDMDALKTAFQARELNPDDLKLAVATFLNRLLDPIREKFDNEPMRRLVAEAYPHFDSLPTSAFEGLDVKSDVTLTATQQAQYDAIVSGLKVIGCTDRLKKKISSGQTVNVLFSVAPVGKPHIGLLLPLARLADFVRIGCKVTVLLADVFAYMDNMKCPWELREQRSEYYEKMLKAMLSRLGVPLDQVRFVRGSNFQLKKDYMLDVYKLASNVTRDAARDAGVAIVKQIEFPMLSALLCPLFQAADEQHLDADVHFGGADQTASFQLAEQILPKIDYASRTHLTCELVPGVVGAKMSASVEDSVLNPLDPGKALKNRLKKAFCEPGNIADNPPLSFVKLIIFSLLAGKPFVIPRPEQHGGEFSIPDAETAEKSFAQEQLHPGDLKLGVESFFNEFLEPIRTEFSREDAQQMFLAAFPPPEKKGKAAKSQKQKAAPVKL